jgi:hypothetical protein
VRCRPNLITLTFDDDGDVEIKVSQSMRRDTWLAATI